MLDDDPRILVDRWVRLSHTPGVRVRADRPDLQLRVGRFRLDVRYTFDVSASKPGARLTITTSPRGGRPLTVLVEVRGRYEVLLAAPGEGRERVFTLEIPRGGTRRVVVLEHPAGVAPDELPGLLPQADELWSRGQAAMPPVFEEANGGGRVAEPRPFPEVLAQVGASMPGEVHVGDPVPVAVLLSRDEVPIPEGAVHDEQVIVMNPDRPLDVVLLRRGFDLDDRELPRETGRRSLSLPPAGEPGVRVVFWLRASQEGESEVQVVVRQGDPQPLATLRLTATVLPPSPVPMDRTASEAAAGGQVSADRAVASTVTPFLTSPSLVVDENLVGVVSELSFDLALPDFRRRFTHVVVDKSAVLAEVFRALDSAWRLILPMPDPEARRQAFHQRLRLLGSRLALDVLPPELLAYLRDHLDGIEELAVITSGETDIPWELVYAGPPGVGEDADGVGFLGRTGLVRWVYSTGHPTGLSIRDGMARFLIPDYVQPQLVLDEAGLELTYLRPFGATAVDPPDAAGIAALMSSGQLDLLHFAGHGISNDEAVPPVRALALADYREGEAVPGADRSRIVFSLEDLRQCLPDSPPLRFAEPGPLVFLNACRVGQAPSTRSEVGGFAETFLRGGAAAFVGCLWSVGDQPARGFVAAFYEALDKGHTIVHATLAGRRAAREAGDISWLAYTVYAHPDARLSDRPPPTPETTSHAKGTLMTMTTEAARKAPALTREELLAIHPYVVCMEDGRLAEGAQVPPSGVEDFKTVKADIDDLFANRLPSFVKMRGKPVPMMLWAHGGLVDKAAGLRVAHTQVEWWLANGVFPVHFVWRTGLAESLWDAVKDHLPGRTRGLDDFFDHLIEAAVRSAHGKDTWGAMKTTAMLASKKDTGGAWYFAQKLAAYVKANPNDLTLHLAGHSAGSIFHSYLIPELLSADIPQIASLNLLAPAIRVDEFKQRIMKKSVLDKIAKLTTFTMTESFEKDDTCMGIYKKSLLYLIRAALEEESPAEILGLQECLRRDPALGVLLGQPGSGAKGEVIWSKTVNGGLRSSSLSSSHGGFDNDPSTMDSLARRVLDNDQLTAGFGTLAGTRGLADSSPWHTEQEVFDYIAARDSGQPETDGRRALCIGINEYPSDDDKLDGCVADARAWKQELELAKFAVEILENGAATRQNIVEGIQQLIVGSEAGDVLVLQYSGHGTTIEDLDGDELEEAKRTGETKDEALCPVDFRQGELLIDDDLGQLWDLLPEGVNLTVFFDSCHSGGGQREIQTVVGGGPARKARLARMTPETLAAFKDRRGGVPHATRSLDNERSVYFGACLATEVAYESNGKGDFTRLALPHLREFLTGTNQQFYDAVLADFGGDRKQTPVLLPVPLASRAFLAPVSEMAKSGTPSVPPTLSLPPAVAEPTLTPSALSHREQAVAAILRGVADLIEA